eukprot:scaffold217505_cov31-Prasinocladus_malaysianus.AAC.1
MAKNAQTSHNQACGGSPLHYCNAYPAYLRTKRTTGALKLSCDYQLPLDIIGSISSQKFVFSHYMSAAAILMMIPLM